jgi:hypothetical protein
MTDILTTWYYDDDGKAFSAVVYINSPATYSCLIIF